MKRCRRAGAGPALLLAVPVLSLVLAVASSASGQEPAAGQPTTAAARRGPSSLPLLGRRSPRELGLRIQEAFAQGLTDLKGQVQARTAAPGEDLADLLVSAALLDLLEPEGTYTLIAAALLRRSVAELESGLDPELAMHAGLALAWLWPRLPEEDKNALAPAVLNVARRFDEKARGLASLQPECPPVEGAVLLLSRALQATPFASEAGDLSRRSGGRWLSEIVPALANVSGDDGGLPGGPTRSALSTMAASYALELLGGNASPSALGQQPFLRDQFVFQRYARLPDPAGLLPLDDTVGRGPADADRALTRVLPLLASRFRDRVLQAEADRRRPSDPVKLWPYLLWYDPRLEATDQVNWPLAYHFQGLGLVIARTRRTPDATTLALRASSELFSGQHDDAGALSIYRRGWVLPPAAPRDSCDRWQHNGLVLWTPPSPGPGERRPLEAVPPGAELLQVAASDSPRITAFETTPYFTYLAADVTAAFAGELTSAVRHVLLVADPTREADVVVVCDIVSPGTKEKRPTLLYHWPAAPHWDVTDHVLTTTTAANRIFCFLAAPVTGLVETETVSAPRAAQGLPAVAGVPTRLHRSRVWAGGPSPVELFLSIICITDSGAAEMPIRGEWIEGAPDRFEVQVDWDAMTCLVAFNADGSPGGFISFEDATEYKSIFERELTTSVQPQRTTDLLGTAPAPLEHLPARASGARPQPPGY